MSDVDFGGASEPQRPGGAARCTRRRLRLGPIVALVVMSAALPACAAVITFSEQPAGEGSLNPNPYTSSHGLPAGVTATFSGFLRSDLELADHTPTSDNRLVFGASDAPATITFNVPVEVPSFWIAGGSFGSPEDDQIVGSLAGLTRFTSGNDAQLSAFQNQTGGAGKVIDTLTFLNFQDSDLDDVTVVAVPEPSVALASAMAMVAGATLARRRRAGPRRPAANLGLRRRLKSAAQGGQRFGV